MDALLVAHLPLRGGGEALRSGICVRTEPAKRLAAGDADGSRRTLDARVPRDGEDFSFAAMMGPFNISSMAGSSAAGRRDPNARWEPHGWEIRRTNNYAVVR